VTVAPLVDADAPCEVIADDRAEGMPDNGKRTAWSTTVLRGGDDLVAINDFDVVEDSPKNCGVLPVEKGFDCCETPGDEESNVGLALRAA
jgi:hypothetical protein